MAILLSPLFHPLTVLLLGHFFVALPAGFTASRSPLRRVIFALLLAYTGTALAMYPSYTRTTSAYGALLGVLYATRPLVYFDRLMLRKWAFENRRDIFPVTFAGDGGVMKDDEGNRGGSKQVDGASVVKADVFTDSGGARFAFGMEVAGSGRMVDTPWEAKNVAPFSASDPNYVPSRASIIARSILIILASFVARETVMKLHSRVAPFYIAPSRVPFLTRLNEVSREEVAVRLVLGVGKWISVYCVLHMTLSAGTIVSALLKPREVRKLRPWFGSLADAHTVRGFWGKFWHQNLRNNFEGPARFTAHRLLRLRPGSLPARYSSVFVIFFLSGVLHVASDIGMNVSPRQSGALRFFCTNALGIMLEDGVREIYRRLFGRPNGAWSRMIGYVWVLVFLSWSTACWQYPQMRAVRGMK